MRFIFVRIDTRINQLERTKSSRKRFKTWESCPGGGHTFATRPRNPFVPAISGRIRWQTGESNDLVIEDVITIIIFADHRISPPNHLSCRPSHANPPSQPRSPEHDKTIASTHFKVFRSMLWNEVAQRSWTRFCLKPRPEKSWPVVFASCNCNEFWPIYPHAPTEKKKHKKTNET